MSKNSERCKTFCYGYLPFTAAAWVLCWLLVVSSRSWAAVLAGGVLVMLWGASILVSQLLILWVKRDRVFYLKCAAITLFSLFVMPFLVALAFMAADRLIKGTPTLAMMNRDLAMDAPGCRIQKITRERRLGGNTYYVESELGCSPPRALSSCVWWYSYRGGVWSRSHSMAVRCPRRARDHVQRRSAGTAG